MPGSGKFELLTATAQHAFLSSRVAKLQNKVSDRERELIRSKIASLSGKLSRGIPKKITGSDARGRSERLRKARLKRWPKPGKAAA
jgi:hypothetical protein